MVDVQPSPDLEDRLFEEERLLKSDEWRISINSPHQRAAILSESQIVRSQRKQKMTEFFQCQIHLLHRDHTSRNAGKRPADLSSPTAVN